MYITVPDHLENGRGSRSNARPSGGALLSDGASDTGTLELTLGVNNDTSVVLKTDEDTVLTAPRLALTDDDGGSDLLAELRLALLDSGENHVTDSSLGVAVEATTVASDGNDVEVLSTGVVGAVDQSAGRQTASDGELVASSTTTT
jgi:hypothetical protein